MKKHWWRFAIRQSSVWDRTRSSSRNHDSLTENTRSARICQAWTRWKWSNVNASQVVMCNFTNQTPVQIGTWSSVTFSPQPEKKCMRRWMRQTWKKIKQIALKLPRGRIDSARTLIQHLPEMASVPHQEPMSTAKRVFCTSDTLGWKNGLWG